MTKTVANQPYTIIKQTDKSVSFQLEGFASCPIDPTKQVILEWFQDELLVHIWDGQTIDPQTVSIPRSNYPVS